MQSGKTPAQIGQFQTVLGVMYPEEPGITIMHEHLLVVLACYFDMPEEASQRAWVDAPVTMDRPGKVMVNRSHNKDTTRPLDIEVAIDEALEYRYSGGVSLIDATSMGIDRDPRTLARISHATDLNIFMGGSYYVPVAHPVDMDDRTEDQLAEEIVRDVLVGVDSINIVFAHLANRIWDMGAMPELARSGCFMEFDHFGVYEDTSILYMGKFGDHGATDVQAMDKIEFLVDGGFGDQVVISHDANFKHQFTRYGGEGIAHILDNIRPRLRHRGFGESQIDALLIGNPSFVLAFV